MKRNITDFGRTLHKPCTTARADNLAARRAIANTAAAFKKCEIITARLVADPWRKAVTNAAVAARRWRMSSYFALLM
jgi:hypothetical protein